MQQYSNPSAPKTRLHIVLAGVAILMFGFGFALVPIYDTLCRVLGINGKVEQAQVVEIDESSPVARDVKVELITTNAENITWNFYPLIGTLTVQPGTTHTIQFYARNNSQGPMTVQAVPSVTPSALVGYLIKTECFCFQKQTLQAGESIKMPLVFHIDPDLPEKHQTLTLSYALFETES